MPDPVDDAESACGRCLLAHGDPVEGFFLFVSTVIWQP